MSRPLMFTTLFQATSPVASLFVTLQYNITLNSKYKQWCGGVGGKGPLYLQQVGEGGMLVFFSVLSFTFSLILLCISLFPLIFLQST